MKYDIDPVLAAFIREKIKEILDTMNDPWHTPAERDRRRDLIQRAQNLLSGK